MKFLARLFCLLACLQIVASHSSSAQFNWTKDPLNPVFSGGGTGTWDALVLSPSVIFNPDSSRYEMWYTARDIDLGLTGIGFAISDDGITWTRKLAPVLVPTPGAWDSLAVVGGWVLREPGQYKMWYTGWKSTSALPHSIGYATSADGIIWTKHPSPVLEPGTQAWEAAASGYCCVIPTESGYTMYYAGETISSARIGRAFSVDGIIWERDTLNNPVLDIGPPGSWDRSIYLPRAVHHVSGYYLFYTAEAVPRSGISKIGVATSTDSGRTWSKYSGNPVLGLGRTWDTDEVELGTVIFKNDTVRMWYDGLRFSPLAGSIGHAIALVTSLRDEQRKPAFFLLEQNYPNPFNPSTSIKYNLPNASDVTLIVYDMLGRAVAVLVNDWKAPGSYEVQLDASGLASGMYVVRLTAGSFMQSRRMVLVR